MRTPVSGMLHVRRVSLYAVTLCTGILIACDPVGGYFDEYIGVNLIENHGFETDAWLPDQTATYITFEAIGGDDATAVGVFRTASTLRRRCTVSR